MHGSAKKRNISCTSLPINLHFPVDFGGRNCRNCAASGRVRAFHAIPALEIITAKFILFLSLQLVCHFCSYTNWLANKEREWREGSQRYLKRAPPSHSPLCCWKKALFPVSLPVAETPVIRHLLSDNRYLLEDWISRPHVWREGELLFQQKGSKSLFGEGHTVAIEYFILSALFKHSVNTLKPKKNEVKQKSRTIPVAWHS